MSNDVHPRFREVRGGAGGWNGSGSAKYGRRAALSSNGMRVSAAKLRENKQPSFWARLPSYESRLHIRFSRTKSAAAHVVAVAAAHRRHMTFLPRAHRGVIGDAPLFVSHQQVSRKAIPLAANGWTSRAFFGRSSYARYANTSLRTKAGKNTEKDGTRFYIVKINTPL
jgi:hypothetical protein